jgi:HSP20 family protein
MNSLTKVQERTLPIFDELRKEMENFWDRPFLFRPLTPSREVTGNSLGWMPTIDVFDKNGELVVKADLPGVKKADVSVAIENGALVIRGHREEQNEIKNADYYRAERVQGEFLRRMALSFEADPKKIDAKFADGVLEVKIPHPVEKLPVPQRIVVH